MADVPFSLNSLLCRRNEDRSARSVSHLGISRSPLLPPQPFTFLFLYYPPSCPASYNSWREFSRGQSITYIGKSVSIFLVSPDFGIKTQGFLPSLLPPFGDALSAMQLAADTTCAVRRVFPSDEAKGRDN